MPDTTCRRKEYKQNTDDEILPEEQFIPENSMLHRGYEHHDFTRNYEHVKNRHGRKQKNCRDSKEKKRKNKFVKLREKREEKNKTTVREKSYFESNKTRENTYRNVKHKSEGIT